MKQQTFYLSKSIAQTFLSNNNQIFFHQIACGVSFKYNYFKKGASWPPYDTVWRSGPEFSLVVPQHYEQDKNIVVRDSWKELGTGSRIPSAHLWGSLIEEIYLPIEPLTSTVPRGIIFFLNRLLL